MPSATKTQRWLDLIAFLAGRRMPVAVEEILEAVPPYAEGWVEGDERGRASVRRKFERDKDELRSLGIPIETVDYSINFGTEQVQGYRLRSSDFYLPWLRIVSKAGEGDERPGRGPSTSRRFELREDEARAAVDALRRVAGLPAFPFRREARSALRKLTFDLPGEIVGAASADPPVRYLAAAGSGDARESLRALSGALLRRKEVEFRYYGIRRDTESLRRVRPYGLLFQGSHWYLVGHDLDREDLRVFRVGRMRSVRVNARRPKTADYEVPDDFDLGDWTGRPSWALPGQEEEPLAVRVRFDFPWSLWAARNDHGELIEELDDGGQLRRFQVQDPDPLLRWLLTLRGRARVEAPPELAEQLRALERRVRRLHGGPAGSVSDRASQRDAGEEHG
ncbi:MAG: WYL domain-containing protein [Gemmatimonadota bacterium]|jgi:proteasome accessory factor B